MKTQDRHLFIASTVFFFVLTIFLVLLYIEQRAEHADVRVIKTAVENIQNGTVELQTHIK